MVLQLILSGLAFGSIYALVALGFVLLVNAVNIVNFAQGEFVMIGAYLILTFSSSLDLPYPAAFLVVLAAAGLLGIIFERLAYWPLRNSGFITVIVSTLGVSVFLKNIAMNIWGPIPMFFSEPFGREALMMGGIRVIPQHLFIIGVTILLVILQFLFFSRTRLGVMMQATAQDKVAASLMGIKVSRMTRITFAYAAVLGAVAGVLLAPVFFITTSMGGMVGLKAFVATIIGGWGSVIGAIVGGLIVGLVEVFSAAYISSLYKDVFAFIILISFLMFLPRGIFGEKISEKV